ncbi:ABC transporter substrate-binding protein [Aureimonas mangrovi]|uniref:ABC transporter substrate-binding protein n=1 Tax=Aureimonas mangrovi TaxID=2758041 RepID=UPI00163D9677|nr:ABC transporter substrate-binding protein [Aureimonas mangrovi]
MRTPRLDAIRPTRRAILAAMGGALAGTATAAFAPRAFAAGEIRIEHAFGEAVLPGPATRVVSLGYTTHDTLLALDVVPLATRQWFGDEPFGVWPWAREKLGDAQPPVISGEVAIETVASLQPDLIVGIGSGISEAEYAILSQIAPTVMHARGAPVYGTPWDEVTRVLARATGKDAMAEELIAQTEAQFEAARERHPDWAGQTAVAAYHFAGETGAFTSNDGRGRFLAELGFRPSETIDTLGADTFYAALSPEDLSPLDVDLLVWISSFDAAPDLVALPMRRTLAAHTQGREVFAGEVTAAALSFGSILSLPYALTQLEGDIAAALDGDPATPVASAVEAGIAP